MDMFEYRVKGGDTLSSIVFKMHGYTSRDARYNEAVAHIMALNPQVKDPNVIFAGNILRISVLPQAQPKVHTKEELTVLGPRIHSTKDKPAIITLYPKEAPTIHSSTIQQANVSEPFITSKVADYDVESFWALSWLEQNSNLLTIPGGVALGSNGFLMNPGNRQLINEVADLYAEFKSGNITKGQYDYRRARSLTQLKKNIGPMEKLLFGNKTTFQSIRIARAGGVPATAHISHYASRINTLSKVSKVGGYALVGVGLTTSCMQIAHTTNRHEKNEIFIETIASTIVGVGIGIAVGLFLISNPVSWGTALVLAVGSAAIAYGLGKAARIGYNISGSRVDFVSGAGLDLICH
jgi:hypothetical protein